MIWELILDGAGIAGAMTLAAGLLIAGVLELLGED